MTFFLGFISLSLDNSYMLSLVNLSLFHHPNRVKDKLESIVSRPILMGKYSLLHVILLVHVACTCANMHTHFI